MTKNNYFRTSQEIFHRIIWDAQFDETMYRIGYMDRFNGIQECSFKDWKASRDVTEETFIPFHRVYYFKNQNGDIVWDRLARISNL